MIRDFLVPLLAQRFPGRFVTAAPGVEPCVVFPAKHPDVGDVQAYDDGDEITVVVGKFTHSHFSNYDKIPTSEKERTIAEDVADFLDELFADQIILWRSHNGGGWRTIDSESSDLPAQRNHYVWSGPRGS